MRDMFTLSKLDKEKLNLVWRRKFLATITILLGGVIMGTTYYRGTISAPEVLAPASENENPQSTANTFLSTAYRHAGETPTAPRESVDRVRNLSLSRKSKAALAVGTLTASGIAAAVLAGSSSTDTRSPNTHVETVSRFTKAGVTAVAGTVLAAKALLARRKTLSTSSSKDVSTSADMTKESQRNQSSEPEEGIWPEFCSEFYSEFEAEGERIAASSAELGDTGSEAGSSFSSSAIANEEFAAEGDDFEEEFAAGGDDFEEEFAAERDDFEEEFAAEGYDFEDSTGSCFGGPCTSSASANEEFAAEGDGSSCTSSADEHVVHGWSLEEIEEAIENSERRDAVSKASLKEDQFREGLDILNRAMLGDEATGD